MRTHGHRKGSTKHWGLLGEKGRASGRGRRGGIVWGETPNVGDRGMEAANHHGMCEPMQQSCKICTCTPELKVKFKKRKENSSMRGQQFAFP